jgi:hypothetical protein
LGKGPPSSPQAVEFLVVIKVIKPYKPPEFGPGDKCVYCHDCWMFNSSRARSRFID